MNFIKKFLTKTIAKQLRKPGGLLASKVGDTMNKSNGFLYDFTIHDMQLQDNESILEIGFGNGKLFNRLFSTAKKLHISGLDFSPEMVKTASVFNAAAIQSGKLTLRLGSSDHIPFPDNSFDKVFCINVIYFWEHPADHLKEIFRVLKPGGTFYTSIRTKETMLQLPFTKYGFKMYTEENWIDTLAANRFEFVHAHKTQNEPGAVIDGEQFNVESLCIAARKPEAN